ncbi:MAG: tol-pal system protein YbgF [candidate division Zixibacteria bacterium RBG_16_53_22]|nr:MAG: tol-pal system protein YbgF [candidate division Zixibacteria bacterium RBG_16_53_22]
MRKFTLLTVLALILLVVAGCATRRQVLELQLEVEAVRADQAQIKAQNAHLDSLFRANIEQSRRVNADFANYINQLDERMGQIAARLEDAVTLINRAAGAMESRGGRRQPGDTTQVDTTRQAGGVDCQKIYNAAYSDFVKERFDMAINGFRNYIESCPNTALSDNAQYWIGEGYFSQKQYDKAQRAFEKMIGDYPSSERLAAGKLKLGRALYEQRQRTNARKYFEDVVKNYPGTDEAQEAAAMLERYR